MLLVFVSASCAWAQEPNSCEKLTNFKAENVEITKAAVIAAGTTEAIPWNQTRTAPLPAYCRVEGVMNRRTGVDGEEFGITFALAMPDQWNGDLLMQGGGGSNGIVLAPLGLNAAGDTPGLIRGFAVVSTDTGHKSRHPGFDFGFVRDEQAYLDFAYLANAEVAALAKQLIAQHYGKPAAFSYFSGCSTRARRHDSFAALSHGFQWHHLRRPRDAHWVFQSRDQPMDSHRVQSNCSERCKRETDHRAVDYRQ